MDGITKRFFTRTALAGALSLSGLGLMLGGALVSEPASAISYGVSDCNEAGTECGNPNVVFLAALTWWGETRAHCTGSFVDRKDGYYLFVTAGHCTNAWNSWFNPGYATGVGVSLLPSVPKTVSAYGGRTFDPAAFVSTVQWVTHSQFTRGFISKFDYGFVAVPVAELEARFPNAAAVIPVTLAADGPLSLESLVAEASNPQQDLKFFSVGYGIGELLNFGSNAGGGASDPRAWLGTRRLAEMQTYDNLRETLLQTSQNPALGNDGTCNGDSGGPTYYQVPGGGAVQVGITSAGDYQCRATGTYSRTDTAVFRDFLACARANIGNLKQCGF